MIMIINIIIIVVIVIVIVIVIVVAVVVGRCGVMSEEDEGLKAEHFDIGWVNGKSEL